MFTYTPVMDHASLDKMIIDYETLKVKAVDLRDWVDEATSPFELEWWYAVAQIVMAQKAIYEVNLQAMIGSSISRCDWDWDGFQVLIEKVKKQMENLRVWGASLIDGPDCDEERQAIMGLYGPFDKKGLKLIACADAIKTEEQFDKGVEDIIDLHEEMVYEEQENNIQNGGWLHFSTCNWELLQDLEASLSEKWKGPKLYKTFSWGGVELIGHKCSYIRVFSSPS
ncbi:hypothetical protein JAAARDRAFT_198521 [Jaapia argillacea MUCL 33604]|uniref:Uncharacterized protein n=1 Tax=Jaapia argillacea MUCL 33604 TaxID=933084 RepID=A0A067PP39_9AGAM|nr:hypothetical protein JAAARDRAFT_198521 [Jaapia argillacea MUCL 33604]